MSQMSSTDMITTTTSNAYVIASAFLLESILQWLLFEYLDIYQTLLGSFTACLVMLMIALIAILVYRFEDCRLVPLWMKMVYALTLVELTICGAGVIITSAPVKPLATSFLVLAVLFAIFSFVGSHMMTTDTTLFVGFLCLWTFISLIGYVLILTFLLAIEDWQVNYIKTLIICVYPALIFNVAYDSRKINNPDREPILLEDNLCSGLYLYGQYVALLVVTLTLVGQ